MSPILNFSRNDMPDDKPPAPKPNRYVKGMPHQGSGRNVPHTRKACESCRQKKKSCDVVPAAQPGPALQACSRCIKDKIPCEVVTPDGRQTRFQKAAEATGAQAEYEQGTFANTYAVPANEAGNGLVAPFQALSLNHSGTRYVFTQSGTTYPQISVGGDYGSSESEDDGRALTSPPSYAPVSRNVTTSAYAPARGYPQGSASPPDLYVPPTPAPSYSSTPYYSNGGSPGSAYGVQQPTSFERSGSAGTGAYLGSRPGNVGGQPAPCSYERGASSYAPYPGQQRMGYYPLPGDVPRQG